jgi:hypothetical protein
MATGAPDGVEPTTGAARTAVETYAAIPTVNPKVRSAPATKLLVAQDNLALARLRFKPFVLLR